MDTTSPECLYQLISNYFPDEELKKVENFIFSETWASPSSRNRDFLLEKEELPLRFKLNIDVKI